MKTSRFTRTLSKPTRLRWASVVFIAVLIAAVASPALWPWLVKAATTRDPNNPGANFQTEGTQPFTPGATLRLADASKSDVIVFFAFDNDAAAGTECDVIATFRITSTVPVNADTGNRVVINDGVAKSAIAESTIQNGVNGIGLYSSGTRSDPTSYPVFVAADWQAAAVTVRLRRTALGDVELIEVNGVTPSPRAILTADKAPANTRAGATVEFGSSSPEAECTVEYSAFRSERVAPPVPQPAAGTLAFTRFRIRDTDSADRIRFRADYVLGNGSDGINPGTEPVTIKLTTAGGWQFYPERDFNPLNGFDVQGRAPKRRWTLNDSERVRTGIERLVFDEDPNNSGAIALRDFRASIPSGDYYAMVNVEITIGTGATTDRLTGMVSLVEKPAGSGRWPLSNER